MTINQGYHAEFHQGLANAVAAYPALSSIVQSVASVLWAELPPVLMQPAACPQLGLFAAWGHRVASSVVEQAGALGVSG